MSENNRHRRIAAQMAEWYGVDPEIFSRLVAKESGWNPNARGAAGEIGYTQPLKETAENPGLGVTPLRDRSDPVDNLRFGAEYLGALVQYYDGDYNKALMAYNGGLGNVNKGTVSDAAKGYAADLMGGKEIKSAPGPRTSNPAQVEDVAGQKAISDGIASLFGGRQLRAPVNKPPSGRYGSGSKMSPLSQMGIPGIDMIAKYSTPGRG